ncbi:MAG TPA: DHH family phosphoesterase, partial [Burkholderiaceae bacterium]
MTRIVARSVPTRAHLMLEQGGVHPLLARLYASRGIKSAEELDTSLGKLIPPSDMKGAAEAGRLLADSIAAEQRILIVADYDCDGATACALGLRGLRMLGAKVDYLVPNRFETGYGLSPEVVAIAAQRKPDLIVTVDNGIASVEG